MSNKIFNEGVFEKGYGMIAKSVMRDKKLSIEAKGIYAYLVSFSGAGLSSFPSTELIISELNISHRRYLSHRKQLVENGYISISRKRVKNGFSKNIYTILSNQTVHEQNVHEQNVHEQGVGAISNSIKSNSIKSSKDKDTVVSNETDDIPYREIVEYLNDKANRNFKHTTPKTRRHIRARYNEGNTLDDFKSVIDIKVDEWLHDSNMSKYLRPETLFGTKFESYLNQKPIKQNVTINTGDVI